MIRHWFAQQKPQKACPESAWSDLSLNAGNDALSACFGRELAPSRDRRAGDVSGLLMIPSVQTLVIQKKDMPSMRIRKSFVGGLVAV